MWFEATSLRRAICALAAIVLVLNCTASGRALPPAASGSGEAPIGYSPPAAVSSSGNFPRLAPRHPGWFAALPTSPQKHDAATGDTPFALTPADLVLSPASDASAPLLRISGSPRIPTLRAFHARAPPRSMV